MTDKIVLSVDRDEWSGGFQISIDLTRKDGTGHGYRIAGPKFNGSSKPVARHTLSERDALEMRRYLDLICPPPHRPDAPAQREGLGDG